MIKECDVAIKCESLYLSLGSEGNDFVIKADAASTA